MSTQTTTQTTTQATTMAPARHISPAEYDFYRDRAAQLRAAAMSQAIGSLGGWIAALLRGNPSLPAAGLRAAGAARQAGDRQVTSCRVGSAVIGEAVNPLPPRGLP